jgi:hypothetical protein
MKLLCTFFWRVERVSKNVMTSNFLTSGNTLCLANFLPFRIQITVANEPKANN